MTDNEILIRKGSQRSVYWMSDEAKKTFEYELSKFSAKNAENIKAIFNRYVEKLSNGSRLPIVNFRSEGKIPGTNQQFYALKPTPIRAYGWDSRRLAGSFIISHCICKKQQELLPADAAKVKRNFDTFEK